MHKFVSSDGTVINYGDSGSGFPLVFIHGWMMSGAVWKYQFPLSGSYRVITPDLRGHGNSGASLFSYAACSDDLVELFNHLSLDSAILVGWSMGSQILLDSWPKLKERVAASLLVSGTPRFCSGVEYPHGLSVAETRSMKARLLRNFERTAGDFFKGMFAPGELDQSGYLEIARNVIGRLPSTAVALSALDELILSDFRIELQNISVPVLLLHGSADLICPASASRYMLERLKRAEMKIFEGSGHAPFLTRAVEFNTIVHNFAREIYGRD